MTSASGGAAADVQPPTGGVVLAVAGRAPALLTPADLDQASHKGVTGNGGSTRAAWPLRELVAAKVGKEARVVALVSEDGKRVEVSASDWADTARTPILRKNNRGLFKFQWVDAKGKMLKTDLRDVTRVEIVP